MDKEIPKCPECGWHFKNVFEAVDHLLEDDDDPFCGGVGGAKTAAVVVVGRTRVVR
jgi:hypothetical protein